MNEETVRETTTATCLTNLPSEFIIEAYICAE